MSHEDTRITDETIRNVLEKSAAYDAAKYDIQNRFLSFSAGHSIESVMVSLLSNNPHLSYELHAMMGEAVDPKLSVIAYQRILGQVTISKNESNAESSKNSFYEAQEFLSRHGNFTALAVHFKCTKRLGSVMEVLSQYHQKHASLIKYVAIPFINLFDLISHSNLSDTSMADMISNLLNKLPDAHLSSESVLQIESLLDQMDKKLLSHITNVFSNEKDGTSILFNSVTSYFFVDKYILDVCQYIFDLFIISSSEFNTGDARLPKIETWRNWICTCVLLEFSVDLLKLNAVNQIISHLESNLKPALQVSALRRRLKDHFVKPFKDFYSVKGENWNSLIKPKWTWDENVVPLTEDLLIDREGRHLFKSQKEQSHVAIEPVESLPKSVAAPKVTKVEKEHGVVDMLFRKTKRKEANPIPELKETNSVDNAREASKKGVEIFAETKPGQPVDVDRAEGSEKLKHINAPMLEEKNKSKPQSEDKNQTKRRVVPDTKEVYSCDIGSIILESAQNVHKAFGLSDSSGSRNLDMENIVSHFEKSGDESLRSQLLSIQTSLFQKEMTTSDIMQLPLGDRELYFQKLETLKSDSLATSSGKKRKKTITKKTIDLYMKDILRSTVKEIESVFVGNNSKEIIKATKDGIKLWKKAELDVQSKIWGRELSREELQAYLKSDSKDDSLETEKQKQANRDEYLRRMSNKISKLI